MLRDHLDADGNGVVENANTFSIRLEYAIVVTFLYGQHYVCNEYCKYYKNIDNVHYKFIPAVDRTSYDGSISHVTGIVNITAEDYEAMPPSFDGDWLREHFPEVARSMDRFIDKIKLETHGEILGDLEIVRIPLVLYRARNATSRKWRRGGAPFVRQRAGVSGRRLGDGLPLLSVHFVGLRVRDVPRRTVRPTGSPLREMQDRYELHMYKQWLRVYMRSKMIKHNKDLFESIDDPLALLEKLHIY